MVMCGVLNASLRSQMSLHCDSFRSAGRERWKKDQEFDEEIH